MDRERLFEAVKSAKGYGGICGDTILRVIDGAMLKYKGEKHILKSVKSTLREISAAFMPESGFRKAKGIALGINWGDMGDVLEKTGEILALHQSTLERKGHFAEMLGDIKRETGFASVLDIGCGLHPFAIPHASCMQGVAYYAMDIHEGAVELVDILFKGLGIEGCAIAGDILAKAPDVQADCAFMFKLLPLLSRLEKNAAARVLRGLEAGFAAVSFPTRSISGRNVGMRSSYGEFVRRELGGFAVVFEKEYANEVLYVMRIGGI